MNELHITDQHSGKMLGMQSMSTSCAANPLCLLNRTIPGSICEKCYAQTLMKMRPALKDKCQRNVTPLTEKILPFEALPYINAQIFRFEAFGELYNAFHLQNYVNIAKKNPHCRFALWSKNYDLVYEFFLTHELPDNMNMLLSSLMINQPVSTRRYLAVGIPVKTFTVYGLPYVEEHGIEINCGARNCLKCGLCYEKSTRDEIRELLKSDKKKKREMN